MNDIAKQRNKAMLVLRIILERCIGIDMALIKIIQKQGEWFRKAAEQGHFTAQLHLLGFDENYSTAVEWYRKASEQGHAEALCNLEMMYENGWSVDNNDSTAVEWYRKAAKCQC